LSAKNHINNLSIIRFFIQRSAELRQSSWLRDELPPSSSSFFFLLFKKKIKWGKMLDKRVISTLDPYGRENEKICWNATKSRIGSDPFY
jgi:hypothetical protein